MTLDQYLAERVAESVVAKSDFNTIMKMSDDSLFEFAKDTGRNEALKVSAEAANFDVFDFAKSVSNNKSFNQIACNVSDRIVSNKVINAAVELVKKHFYQEK